MHDWILFATLLMVKVAQERLKDAFHHVFIASEVDETVFTWVLLVRQQIGIQHFTDADDEAVKAVIAIESDILERVPADVDDSYLREAGECAEQIFLDLFVQILVPEEPVHHGVHDLVEQDVAGEVIKSADCFPYAVPVSLDSLRLRLPARQVRHPDG